MPGWLDVGRNSLSYGGSRSPAAGAVAPAVRATAQARTAVKPAPRSALTHGAAPVSAVAVDPARVAAKPATPRRPPLDPAVPTGHTLRTTARNPAAIEAATATPAPVAAPPAPTGNATLNRYVLNPAQDLTNAAYLPGTLGWGMYAAGKPLSYVPKVAPLGRALVQGGARLGAATAPYTAPIIGGAWRGAAPKFPVALAVLSAVDGAFKLNQMLQDPAGGEARLQSSLQRYGNASPAGYAGNVALDSLRNLNSLSAGDGTPLAELGEATIGAVGPRATVNAEYEAERGRELDAALRSRQAAEDQATINAMQSGTASQQQLRDALARARQQQRAEIQGRNWRPWLWGMSQ